MAEDNKTAGEDDASSNVDKKLTSLRSWEERVNKFRSPAPPGQSLPQAVSQR